MPVIGLITSHCSSYKRCGNQAEDERQRLPLIFYSFLVTNHTKIEKRLILFISIHRKYLTIIPRAQMGYESIQNKDGTLIPTADATKIK